MPARTLPLPSFRSTVATLSIVLLATAAPVAAQTALPIGKPASGTATESQPAVYTFQAASAGVLTVAVQGSADLTLTLRDASGQVVPNGTADSDLNGSTGTELLSVIVGRPGAYRIEVGVFSGGSSEFQVAGGFVAFPPFELAPDPDGTPDGAIALPVGEGREDSLDTTRGDTADWFVLKPTQDATLAVVTRSGGGEIDLQIEVFLDGKFDEPADRSDQDQQGDTANEAVTVAVRAGQVVHVKVSGVSDHTVGAYRVSSSLITMR